VVSVTAAAHINLWQGVFVDSFIGANPARAIQHASHLRLQAAENKKSGKFAIQSD
jgi:hypothetical protein